VEPSTRRRRGIGLEGSCAILNTSSRLDAL
jgi:hypothetical protein